MLSFFEVPVLSNLISSLVPSETRFFDLLESQANFVADATSELDGLFRDFANLESHASAIRSIEEKADILRRQLVSETRASFLTPYDREDLFVISSSLDDVIDHSEAIASMATTHGFNAFPPVFAFLSGLLRTTGLQVQTTVFDLRAASNAVEGHCWKIKELENQSQVLVRAAKRELFTSTDAVHILRVNDVIQNFERAFLACDVCAERIHQTIVKMG